MKKKFWLILLTLLTALCLALGISACGGTNGGKNSVNGTYYRYESEQLDKSDWYELKNGKWKDSGGEQGTYKLSDGSILFYEEVFGENINWATGTVKDGVLSLSSLGMTLTYCKEGSVPSSGSQPGGTTPSVQDCTIIYDANGGEFLGGDTTFEQTVKSGTKLTAPVSPARSNYTFAGWAKSKGGSEMWKFDEDTVSGNTTLYAQWSQESAIILSVEGASIEDREIFMFVDRNTTSVSLSGKVVCSDDSIWRLYSDPEGQREIPTKMVANLTNGSNVYYIVVNSQNQAQVNVYELTVHRSYPVSVSYYNGDNLLKTETTYTGEEFTTTYKPDITGYTFNWWKKQNGSKFTSEILWSPLSLYADKTAKTYKVTFDENGGEELSEAEKTLTYGSSYSLPTPTRTGYSFTGWYYGSAQLTNAYGRSLEAWNYTSEKELTAHWEANRYAVTLKQNDSEAGTVSGGGDHAYDSQVTITASTNTGYNFLGWYDKDGELVSETARYTFKMGFDVSYTAKWDYYTLTTTRNNEQAGTLSKTYTDEKVSVGTKVTLKAITNKGYTFLGWYKGEEEVSTELSYQYTMTKENVSFEARWMKCPVTVSSGDASIGSVNDLPDTTVIGQEITLVATTNRLGYIFDGWYKGEEQVSAELSFQITISKESVSYEAKWSLDPNMAPYRFSSTTTQCTIIDVEDETRAEYIVPDYVTSIGRGAFVNCSSIQSITIPFVGGSRKTSTDTYQYPFGYIFGTSQFSGASKTTQDYYESSTNSTTYTDYYIPDSLKSVTVTGGEILDWAFSRCNRLTSVTIGSGVTSIGWSAFYKCSGLESVTIGSGVTSIGGYAFSGCSGLESVIWNAENCTYAGYYSNGNNDTIFQDCTNLNTVTFGENVKKIPAYAFYNCSGLTSITIPDGVTSIGDSAFYRCSGLEKFIVDEDNTVYSSQDGVLYNKEKTEIIKVPSAIKGAVTIPDSMTSIGDGAFSGYSGLTSVTIGSGVTKIGNRAFNGCSGLISISIPDSVISIGYEAFSSTAFYMDISNWDESNVLYIGNYLIEAKDTISGSYSIRTNTKLIAYSAFSNCKNLVSVTIPDGVTTIGESAFVDCSGLTGVYISDLAAWCRIDFSNDYFANPLYYAHHLYLDGNEVKDLTIPAEITKIKAYAFYDCDGLTSITIPDSVTSIGMYAFYGTAYYNDPSNWDESGVLYIGNYLIDAKKTISGSYTVRDNTKLIADYAFYYCEGLTSVTISDSVTSIGRYAFSECSGLKRLTIGSGVTSIGARLFATSRAYGCNLQTITYHGTVKEWESIEKTGWRGGMSRRITIYCTDDYFSE